MTSARHCSIDLESTPTHHLAYTYAAEPKTNRLTSEDGVNDTTDTAGNITNQPETTTQRSSKAKYYAV